MRLLTRAAAKRLAVLAIVLGIGVGWCGCSMIRMPLKSFSGSLPELTPEQTRLRDELRRHVEKLAGEIGERNVYRPSQLNAAANYINRVFTESGYKVEHQTYSAQGETCTNLSVEIRGRSRPDEIVVIGAHYDTVAGSPGANDNGSGTAAVLSLAALWTNRQPARTIRFVAFVNEEPPFFQTDDMGSVRYARQCRERGERIVAMLSLETMGFYSTDEGSQKYPFPVGLFYPSRGDFIGFVGNVANGSLVRRTIRTFRERASFPSEGAALYDGLPGIGRSDHWAFWQSGYPAIMITDTAPFRYPHYHLEEDTPDKLDYERLARVVDGLVPVIEELLNSDSK